MCRLEKGRERVRCNQCDMFFIITRANLADLILSLFQQQKQQLTPTRGVHQSGSRVQIKIADNLSVSSVMRFPLPPLLLRTITRAIILRRVRVT